MSSNPLVAPETSMPDSGALGLLQPVDNAVKGADAMAGGEFVEGSLSFAKGGLDVLGFISDPLGALFSWGVGWLIDHVEPFPTWLDQLAGDPDLIHSFASTWHNVSGRVHANADSFREAVQQARGDWSGLASEAYGATAQVVGASIDGMAVMITGVAGAVEVAGGLVGGVRSTVKDTISEIVGAIGSSLVKFLTVVLAPDAVRSLSTKVATLSAKIGKFIDDLITSMGKFGSMLDDLFKFLQEFGQKIVKVEEQWFGNPYSPAQIALNGGIQLSSVDNYPAS